MKKAVIALSGGVDSSVAAYLLKQQGYDLIGLFMKNWEEKDSSQACSSAEDYEDVLSVCNTLQIPCHSVNFSKEYWNHVFAPCLEDFAKGYTPNPDILCNREIKFKCLFDKAIELGGEFLATGHYAQIGSFNGQCTLEKGVDENKDQSYFLYTLKAELLKKVRFPLGHLEKPYVRALAEEAGLCTATKKDSTGICFIGKRKFRPFLQQYIEKKPGKMQTLEGKVVGEHEGLSFYTIGQRKGLSIGGEGEAWFVLGKDVEKNILLVGQGEENQALYSTLLYADNLSFVGDEPQNFPFACQAKVRYRQSDVPCVIEKIENGRAKVRFLSQERAVTPKQSIVFYEGMRCLGGGLIL
jgi:tRNA-uridine 2-sulfurtransferase